MEEKTEASNPERREFLKKSCAAALGAVTVLVPVGAGLATLMDPLHRKTAALDKILVTSLASLPADGAPRKYEIVASRADAWNKYPNVPIGAIYLRRTGEGKVEALNVVCPHAGCFIDFLAGDKKFYCPCHNSSFDLNGAIADAKSPSPRGMDALEVEVRNGTEVWVKFQNFQTGHAEKIPVA